MIEKASGEGHWLVEMDIQGEGFSQKIRHVRRKASFLDCPLHIDYYQIANQLSRTLIHKPMFKPRHGPDDNSLYRVIRKDKTGNNQNARCDMKKIRKVVAVIFSLSMIMVGPVLAGEYKLSVYIYPQKTRMDCSRSVVIGWAGWKKGVCYSPSQQTSLINKLSLDIRTKALLCYGWNAGDVEKALEELTGSSFAYHNHYDRSSAFKRMKEELKEQRRPLAISGNSCTPNGTPNTPQKHWMLMEALRLINDNTTFDGCYIKDPLYGSSFASDYEVLRPRTWVRDLFTKWWIPNTKVSTNFRQSVED